VASEKKDIGDCGLLIGKKLQVLRAQTIGDHLHNRKSDC
jgi:hypothetical protein